MNETARIRHYIRLIATGESKIAAPEKNLIGFLVNNFAITSDELSAVEKYLTFIRLKYLGSEPTEKELSDIVETILLTRSGAGKDGN